jgi:hypothetical protein
MDLERATRSSPRSPVALGSRPEVGPPGVFDLELEPPATDDDLDRPRRTRSGRPIGPDQGDARHTGAVPDKRPVRGDPYRIRGRSIDPAGLVAWQAA